MRTAEEIEIKLAELKPSISQYEGWEEEHAKTVAVVHTLRWVAGQVNDLGVKQAARTLVDE